MLTPIFDGSLSDTTWQVNLFLMFAKIYNFYLLATTIVKWSVPNKGEMKRDEILCRNDTKTQSYVGPFQNLSWNQLLHNAMKLTIFIDIFFLAKNRNIIDIFPLNLLFFSCRWRIYNSSTLLPITKWNWWWSRYVFFRNFPKFLLYLDF